MNNKIALSKNSSDIYSPSQYLNILNYPFNSCKCHYSTCGYNCDCFCHYKNHSYKQYNCTLEQKTFDLINDYCKTRNTDIITNYNNIIYSNQQRKNKKVEFSKSLEKKIKPYEYQINYTYDNKSLHEINKEIIKFKNKMNKDKEYLNNIQSKLFTNTNTANEVQKTFINDSSNENIKLRKRAYSLSNRTPYYRSLTNNNKNINFELNNFYSEKRKIRDTLINNNIIKNNILEKSKLNILNNYQEDSYTNNKLKENDLSSNKICYPKRNNSFLSITSNNKILYKFDIINNNNINNKYKKNNYINKNETKRSKNINEYAYIKYPEKEEKNVDKKQNKFSNNKYLTIKAKNDKIQLKEKEIKINDISNLNNIYINSYNSECNYINSINKNSVNNFTQYNKNKKELLKYKTKKYDAFIDDIINENNKENVINNNKNKKISLNNINLITNYENIKKKYNNNTNNTNNTNNNTHTNTSNYYHNKNYIPKKTGSYNNDEKKEPEIITNQNNKNSTSTLKNINMKYSEDIKLKHIKKKYSDTFTNREYTNNYNIKENNNTKINNILNTITSFSIKLITKEEKNKDLIIKNLNEKIVEFEKQLKIANSKIKDLSKIIEEIKNKNKLLYIDKITSFNYITIQNHYIKLNKTNLNININRNKRQKLNNDEIIIHLPDRSILGRSKNASKYIHTLSDNEHHSYSSFDNYKNMNIYFRKITTIVNDQKIHKNKPVSLSKNPIRYNKNCILNKINIKTESSKNNNCIGSSNFIKDIKINEKIIYALYPSKGNSNILYFEPDVKKFSIEKIVNTDNFEENFSNYNEKNRSMYDVRYTNGNIFLYNEGYLYIVTGKDFNIFYKYDPYKKEIIKLCKLKYNHSNGNLIYYDQRIFCLSGDFNKKVECYIESKNEWIDIPELLTERSNFSTCIINEQYLFVLFGYNNINKQYLNSIEFIDLLYENAKWKYLYYDNNKNISLFFIGALALNYDDKKIIIFGGYDGKNKKGNSCFYQINLKRNFDDEENYDIRDDKLSHIDYINHGLEINKSNKCYFLDKGYNKYYESNSNLFYTFFDSEFHAHLININTFSHEIYKIE